MKKLMVLNPEKILFMSTGQTAGDAETSNFNDLAVKSCKEVEILLITSDIHMVVHTHIKNVCRKAGQKLKALLRISP